MENWEIGQAKTMQVATALEPAYHAVLGAMLEPKINEYGKKTSGLTVEKASGAKDVIKNNLGKEIDITPSKAHTKVNKNPGPFGEPNSSVDILDSKGELTTRRFYDETGKAIRDVDMTNHGNPKRHPEYPHEHKWKYDSNGKPTRE